MKTAGKKLITHLYDLGASVECERGERTFNTPRLKSYRWVIDFLPASISTKSHSHGILETERGGGFMRKKEVSILVVAVIFVLCCSCIGIYLVNNVPKGTITGKKEKTKVSTTLPELKIGTTVFAPYFYIGEDGKEAGIDVDIAKEACKRSGYEPVFKQITWGEQDKLLDTGAIDCVWCCLSMNGREARYQWAGPYMYSTEAIVVAKDSDIHSLSDLKGKVVGVEVDSKSERFFLNDKKVDVKTVSTYSSLEDAFTAFGKGYVDAVSDQTEALQNYTSENAELYRYIETSVMKARLGVAFKKEGETGIPAKLTDVLDEMNRDGTIKSIIKKYGLKEENLLGVSSNEK